MAHWISASCWFCRVTVLLVPSWRLSFCSLRELQMPPPPIEPAVHTGVATLPVELGEFYMHSGTQLQRPGRIWHLQLGLLCWLHLCLILNWESAEILQTQDIWLLWQSSSVDDGAAFVSKVVGANLGAVMESAKHLGGKASLESWNSTSLSCSLLLDPGTTGFSGWIYVKVRSDDLSVFRRSSRAWFHSMASWLITVQDSGHPLTVQFRVTPSPCCCSPHCGGAKASIKLFQSCAIIS